MEHQESQLGAAWIQHSQAGAMVGHQPRVQPLKYSS